MNRFPLESKATPAGELSFVLLEFAGPPSPPYPVPLRPAMRFTVAGTKTIAADGPEAGGPYCAMAGLWAKTRVSAAAANIQNLRIIECSL